MLRLRTFGGLWVEATGGGSALALTPRRLALLAVVAGSGQRGTSRDRVLGLLWSDRPEELGRHALSQTLYSLRRELGAEVVIGTNELRLDPAQLSSDVGDFLVAAQDKDRPRQAELYTGAFLDGFYLPDTPAFERWAEEERSRHRQGALEALDTLAQEEARAGRHRESARWLQKLTNLDPLNGSLAVRYMRSLADAGDRAGALSHARAYQLLVRRELDAPPDPEVTAMMEELKHSTSRVAARATAAAVAAAPVIAPEPFTEASADVPAIPAKGAWLRRTMLWSLAVFVAIGGLGVLLARRPGASPGTPMLAVGVVRDQTAPDTLRAGSVLTDMLATSIGRLEALRVVANPRLLELMLPGTDTSRVAVFDAARRAGAEQILEGEIRFAPQGGLLLELRRVDLRSGVVRRGYRLSAPDRYGLVDSATTLVARDLGAALPERRVAEVTTTSPLAYRLYEEGLRAYYQYDAAAAFRLMSAALEQDSLFPMAAYYAWLSAKRILDWPAVRRLRPMVHRLANRASDRERLIALLTLAHEGNDPAASLYADTLGIRFPEDPQAIYLVGSVRFSIADYARAIPALERAISLDSAAEATRAVVCRICEAFQALTDVYAVADSAEASLRAARRWTRLRPDEPSAWSSLAWAAWRTSRYQEGDVALRRFDSLGGHTGVHFQLQRGILREDYANVAALGQSQLSRVGPAEEAEARWHALIALRNLGRYREAKDILQPPHRPVTVDDYGSAIALMEMGSTREAAQVFLDGADVQLSNATQGHVARGRTWAFALAGTALAAAGDTAAVRRLADSTEVWGRQSLYGRDPRLHFFLRGLLLAGEGRDAEAVDAFRRSLISLSYGYTRINYEMAGSLIRLRRPREAVTPLQQALRGGIDGSNLYMTRTELHERLAQAFAAAGMRDSAAAHYRKVEQAWEGADPQFASRVQAARAFLAHR